MEGIIGFKNHKINCIIGVYPQERTKHQEILVDLSVVAQFGGDKLGETVDYEKLSQVCTELAQKNQYQLIETFGADVLKEISNNFPIQSATIRVKKPEALASADYTFVELKWAGR